MARYVKHHHTVGPRGENNRSTTYNSWRAIIDRCCGENNKVYSRYGARGITVCDRWLDFNSFLEDMGERPTKNHSIDRIDNQQGYYHGNCRWATKLEQMRNMTTNRLLTVNGETMPVSAWAERIGRPANTLYTRLSRGWSHERVVSR